MSDTFEAMEELIEDWMRGARDQEVQRVLALVREELLRRGQESPCQPQPQEAR